MVLSLDTFICLFVEEREREREKGNDRHVIHTYMQLVSLPWVGTGIQCLFQCNGLCWCVILVLVGWYCRCWDNSTVGLAVSLTLVPVESNAMVAVAVILPFTPFGKRIIETSSNVRHCRGLTVITLCVTDR